MRDGLWLAGDGFASVVGANEGARWQTQSKLGVLGTWVTLPTCKGGTATCGPRWQAEMGALLRLSTYRNDGDYNNTGGWPVSAAAIQTQLLPSLVEPLNCFVLAD